MSFSQQPISIYLHIPFCTHRCGYCDFNTYAGLEDLIPDYVDALIAEARQVAETSNVQMPVHTLFFGGGTPSLLAESDIRKILNELRRAFAIANDAELTIEANPGTLNPKKLVGLREAGINRLSFGVQSSSPTELRLLERQHDFQDVINAVKWARQAGFDNLNLDWIYGLPGQSLESWQRNIELAISLNPEHLSLYALSIEHGTPFKEMSARGLLPALDPDIAADMYEWASDALDTAGYRQYEISNWSKPGKECRHNLQYWRCDPYIGLGAGAHGFIGGFRTANVLAPAAYISRMMEGSHNQFPRTSATVTFEAIDDKRAMGETMMMGLRLVQEGVGREPFSRRFRRELDEVYGPQIDFLQKRGLLETVNGERDAIRLTKNARLLGNQVFIEFI
jgi:oxygen-independent coproporphyrinogen-3 oxidase